MLPHRPRQALLLQRGWLRLRSAQRRAIDADADAPVSQPVQQRIDEMLLRGPHQVDVIMRMSERTLGL
jgi:hypothetical protein